MKLDGLHHITMITGDAQRNVDFYADLLGLRLVKTTVNFDAPEAYHLYFGDETGSPGSILTWFEFAGAARRPRRRRDDPHAAAGRRLPGGARLLGGAAVEAAGVTCERGDGTLRFADYDGLGFELRGRRRGQPAAGRRPSRGARRARPDRPPGRARLRREPAAAGAAAHRDARFRRATARAATGSPASTGTSTGPTTSPRPSPAARAPAPYTTSPGPAPTRTSWTGSGACGRPARWSPTSATATTSRRSTSASRAGSCSRSRPSPPASPSTRTPTHLGEALKLPRMHEHLRPQLERTLTPLVNPRARAAALQA